MTKDTLKETIEQKGIQWIQVHFTDLLGRLRVVHIPARRFIDDDIVNKGVGFDGSSVGLVTVDKSDMTAVPDASTLMVLPNEENEARIIAELYDTKGNHFPADPRYILRHAVEAANTAGFDAVTFSPEMEFYVFDETEEPRYNIKENEGYFLPPPLDDIKEYRKTLADMVMRSGYEVKYHHHETGRNQHEVEIKALPVLAAADFCGFFKYLAQDLAHKHHLLVTFMPKPLSEEAGSGMHAHITFFKQKKNMFLDENNPYRLSQTARYFIGGILDHSRGMAALANPTLNSYKRLIPHFEAPIYIAWAQYNRSSLIRIPAKKDVDVEIRNADPAANPYLVFAAMIHAGLDGIKKKISYDPIEKNIYKMSDEEIEKSGIRRLPTNLMEALEEFESDTVLQQAVGKEAAALFVEKKKTEWRQYMSEITDLDYRFYFHC